MQEGAQPSAPRPQEGAQPLSLTPNPLFFPPPSLGVHECLEPGGGSPGSPQRPVSHRTGAFLLALGLPLPRHSIPGAGVRGLPAPKPPHTWHTCGPPGDGAAPTGSCPLLLLLSHHRPHPTAMPPPWGRHPWPVTPVSRWPRPRGMLLGWARGGGGGKEPGLERIFAFYFHAVNTHATAADYLRRVERTHTGTKKK